MKLFKRTILIIVILALNLALAWTILGDFAAAPPSGEPYHLVADWPKLPEGLALGQVSGVDVDSSGNVFVFHRAERVWQGEELGLDPITSPTVSVFNSQTGTLMKQWGAGTFVMPHSLTIDHEDNIWLTDVGLHQVFKFDHEGNQLMALGEPGAPGDDAAHFNQPTDVAVAPDGAFYVSDGYSNSRILKFSSEGRFLESWGTKGTAPGQFDLPHSLA